MADPERRLRDNHDYVRLWAGAAISGLGSQLSVLAYPLLVLALGGGAARAGAVGTCSLVSRMIFRIPGGQLTDRLDWRRLMIAMDAIRLAAVGSIPLAAAAGSLGFAQLIGVAVVEGAATAFFRPGSSVALRDVVPADQLRAAFSLGQSRAAAIDLLGPLLGGALFGLGRTLPFTVDAATYAVSALLLASLRIRPRRSGGGARRDTRVTAGLRWLAGQSEVVRILAFAALINVVGAAAEIAVVVVLREHGTRTAVIGVVMACAGVGGFAGALAAPRILARLESAALHLAVGALWALGLGAFALDSSPLVIGPLLVLLLMVTPAVGIRLGETTVGRAPRELLGRISMAEETLTGGLAAAGPLLAGAALQGLGVSATWAAMAGLCALTALAVSWPAGSRAARQPRAVESADTPLADTTR